MDNSTIMKLQPQNIMVEQMVLGALMNFQNAYTKVQMLTEDAFYDKRHQIIFAAIKSLRAKDKPVDLVTVMEEIERTGKVTDELRNYILEVYSSVSTSANIEEHSLVVLDRAVRRRLIEMANDLMIKAYDESTDMTVLTEDTINEMSKLSCNNIFSEITMAEATEQMLERITQAQSGVEMGVPTGFSELDSRGGFSLGDLVVIGADTSVGKSSLAWNIAVNAASKGYPIGYVTLEMSPAQLSGRAASRRSFLPAGKITNPAASGDRKLNPSEMQLLRNVAEEIKPLLIYISESSSDEQIYSQIKTWVYRHKVKGVFIDYLQILSATNNSFNTETEFLTNVSRRLKNLAKKLDIFICVLSQFSRPQGGANQLGLSRLRGSQEIASASDITILISRPEIDNTVYPRGFEDISTIGTALIDVKKGRNIGTFKFIVRYDSSTTTFSSIDGELPLAVDDPPIGTHIPTIDDIFKLQ